MAASVAACGAARGSPAADQVVSPASMQERSGSAPTALTGWPGDAALPPHEAGRVMPPS